MDRSDSTRILAFLKAHDSRLAPAICNYTSKFIHANFDIGADAINPVLGKVEVLLDLSLQMALLEMELHHGRKDPQV